MPARDPGIVRVQRLEQRLDLADVAAAVGARLPEVGPLALVLLGDREHVGDDEPEPVALHEPLAGLVRLLEEQVRVELDDVDLEPELGDEVDEHRGLLLPRAREAEPLAELLVGPGEEVARRQRLDLGLSQGELRARAHRA
jgi:hypothetical protein